MVVTEQVLGLPVSTKATLMECVGGLRFEIGMILVGRLQGELIHIRTDAVAQLELAAMLLEDPELLAGITAFLAGGPRRIVFSEQNLTALERLVVLHASDGEDLDDITAEEIEHAKAALLGVPSVVEAAELELRGEAQATEEATWAYTMQNGAYNATEPPLHTLARAYILFVELVAETEEHENYVPLAEWCQTDHGLTLEEMYAAGWGLHVAARVIDQERNLAGRGVIDPPENSALFRDNRAEIESVLTADRQWYREQFAALGDDDRALAWERTPFLQRPFLRCSDGRWRLVSPRALHSWLGDGFYHRALQSAQRRDLEQRNERSEITLRFTRYFGHLAEQYVLKLGRSVFDGVEDAEVSGEQIYGRGGGKKTSDVAVAYEHDLVLFEVVSARLNRQMQVEGDPAQLASALERMVLKKAHSLARVIADIRSGAVTIPGLDLQRLERVWPLVVTAGGTLFQTDLLWDRIDPELPVELREAPAKPLTLLDMEDTETLLGHVPLGYTLPEILEQKTAGAYRRRNFILFQHDVLGTPNTTRAPLLEQRFHELGQLVAGTLLLDPAPGE